MIRVGHEQGIERGAISMTFRTLLVIKAVVCFVFGVFCLFAPASLLDLLGAPLGAGGMFTAREYGAALIGTLLLTWLAKGVTASDARRAILVDLMVYDAIGAIVTLLAVLSGVLNTLGWGIVVVYGFFTVGSGYLLVVESALKRTHAPTRA
jgi:hypothetical protein